MTARGMLDAMKKPYLLELSARRKSWFCVLMVGFEWGVTE